MKNISTTEAFGKFIVTLGCNDERIVVLNADLTAATKTQEFEKLFPERCINMGIAEQNMTCFAVGLATVGLIPLACSFAVFSTGRAFDQIRQSACYPKINIKIIGTHGGITIGEDGATHQAVLDIALMRSLPNMTVIVPSDAVETEKALAEIIRYFGPVYLRLGRSPVPVIHTENMDFQIGKAETLRQGCDVAIIANGIMVSRALEAAEMLQKETIIATVINMHTVKPIDERAVMDAVKTKRIVTAEEHSVIGGLGSAVNDCIIRNNLNDGVKIMNIGIQDCFGQTGNADELLEYYGLTSSRIANQVRKLMFD